eukprot:gnl/TRDRNA2_/TRDRNA2_135618_c1_seq2.p1 gnl/TRDRNA2_/TRDRNA2_135618_c1~~gnl/TRDRNA2_/TRDRNA2_135618_c1_seq2.p1  ORF type:complete len:114 (+),score=7.43 gnl/TRDRNA2_/TRDRNA2_135618_c1_seq2:210-551(+)
MSVERYWLCSHVGTSIVSLVPLDPAVRGSISHAFAAAGKSYHSLCSDITQVSLSRRSCGLSDWRGRLSATSEEKAATKSGGGTRATADARRSHLLAAGRQLASPDVVSALNVG